MSMQNNDAKYNARRGVYKDQIYATRDLADLPRPMAEGFITRLYSDEERFVQGFFRYTGRMALTHSLSVINGERNLGILRYGFLLVALEAVPRSATKFVRRSKITVSASSTLL
jgi:hypothetical protein